MLLTVNDRDPRPYYLQIAGQIKEQIRKGYLRPGDELLSVRELAKHLGINLHTVHRAYQKLRDQGVITLRLGQRARVAPLREQPASRADVEQALVGRLKELITEAFHLGLSEAYFRELVAALLEEKERGGTR